MDEQTGIREYEKLNEAFLVSALNILHRRLLSKMEGAKENSAEGENELKNFFLNSSSSFIYICRTFNLSLFESEILLLCAGVETDSRFPQLCSKLSNDPSRQYCTLGTAFSYLDEPRWASFNPGAPLRRWKLIEPEISYSLLSAPVRIDEKILHEMMGVSSPDERMTGIIKAVMPDAGYHKSDLSEKITDILKDDYYAVIHLTGRYLSVNRMIAIAASSALNINLFQLNAADIPAGIQPRINISRLWERESYINNNLLLIENDMDDPSILKNLRFFIEDTDASIIISGAPAIRDCRKNIFTFNEQKMSPDEKLNLWKLKLGRLSGRFNGEIEKAAMHFNLSPEDIHQDEKLFFAEDDTVPELKAKFWEYCRIKTRRSMENFVQRIESSAAWNDIVLPDAQLRLLKDIPVHVEQRYKVYESWGFRDKSIRGLGISALFTGASGTGKTLAAEILSNELKLDLYKIDLSSVVSKYIGETEKNLAKVFDDAEQSGAILFFDEADALFGKRSEVKDSHDRYANIEVSYLLQRIEQYTSLCILATNLKGSIDQAFIRRIRFIIQFPFPDYNQRLRIWTKIFPEKTPVRDLDYHKLAQLSITGGNIRNIALNAAFIAANENDSITMKHILVSSQNEYAKLEKSLSAKETDGWE